MAKRSREDFEPSSPDSNLKIDSNSPSSLSAISPSRSPILLSKIAHLDPEGGQATSDIKMSCSLPPHPKALPFVSYEDYEVHYNKTHTNRCLECRKNFPSEHFLNLHIQENHDSFARVRKEKGEKIYACFVEACERNCSNPQKRRMHLIDKHHFPKDYDFYVVNDGIDHRSSMLRSGKQRRRSSATWNQTQAKERTLRQEKIIPGFTGPDSENDTTNPHEQLESTSKEINSPPIDEDMKDLVGAMATLRFVPPSVRFGRGRGRGGFNRS